MSKTELIHEQKIQLKTQIILIKELLAKVTKRLRAFTALIGACVLVLLVGQFFVEIFLDFWTQFSVQPLAFCRKKLVYLKTRCFFFHRNLLILVVGYKHQIF